MCFGYDTTLIIFSLDTMVCYLRFYYIYLILYMYITWIQSLYYSYTLFYVIIYALFDYLTYSIVLNFNCARFA